MANLAYAKGRWMNLEKPGGAVFFVGGGTVAYEGIGASDNNRGLTPEEPLSTIDGTAGAVNKCVSGRGDTIVLLPGSVTITAAMAFDVADLTLTGVDNDSPILPSAIVVNAAIDGINVSVANVVIENIHFAASTLTGVTSRINAGAAGLTVRNCTFECGEFDLETITIPAAGLHTTVDGCRFYVTANGPDAAIEIEAAAAHFINITNNLFHGQNDTNAWDVGAVNSAVAHLDCLVKGNTSTFGPAIIFSAAATGMISDNDMGEGTLGSMLDPGSCMCARNFEADAVDEHAREFPTGAAA